MEIIKIEKVVELAEDFIISLDEIGEINFKKEIENFLMFLKELKGRGKSQEGFEDFYQSPPKVPWLILVQTSTPALASHSGEFIYFGKRGEVQSVGREFAFIPLKFIRYKGILETKGRIRRIYSSGSISLADSDKMLELFGFYGITSDLNTLFFYEARRAATSPVFSLIRELSRSNSPSYQYEWMIKAVLEKRDGFGFYLPSFIKLGGVDDRKKFFIQKIVKPFVDSLFDMKKRATRIQNRSFEFSSLKLTRNSKPEIL